METNRVPPLHMDDNPTGCCPRFHPEDWDGVALHFRDKHFVRAEVREALHVPLNMGPVFARVDAAMRAAGAFDPADFIVLSRDTSAWKGEHYFAVTGEVPGEEMASLSGDFITRVFEGPFSQAGDWARQMQAEAARQGKPGAEVWFYYSTCPKCAKVYGKNYVVGLAQM